MSSITSRRLMLRNIASAARFAGPAEIEEILWVDPRRLPDIDLAPLSRDLVLPWA